MGRRVAGRSMVGGGHTGCSAVPCCSCGLLLVGLVAFSFFVARAAVFPACLSPSTADEVLVCGRCPWIGLDACCSCLRRSRAGLGMLFFCVRAPQFAGQEPGTCGALTHILVRSSSFLRARAHAVLVRCLCIHRQFLFFAPLPTVHSHVLGGPSVLPSSPTTWLCSPLPCHSPAVDGAFCSPVCAFVP